MLAVSASVVIIYKRGRIKVEREREEYFRDRYFGTCSKGVGRIDLLLCSSGRAAREEKEFASNRLPSFFLSSPRFARVTRAREQTSKVNLFLYRAKNTSKPRHCSRAPTNFLLTDRTVSRTVAGRSFRYT